MHKQTQQSLRLYYRIPRRIAERLTGAGFTITQIRASSTWHILRRAGLRAAIATYPMRMRARQNRAQ